MTVYRALLGDGLSEGLQGYSSDTIIDSYASSW